MSTGPAATLPPPDLTTVITQDQLEAGVGKDGGPIYIGLFVAKYNAVVVFNVQSRADLYGPGCGYSVFAGKDASRALATMQLKETKTNIDDLNETQLKTLADWAAKYETQYPIVGVLQAQGNL